MDEDIVLLKLNEIWKCELPFGWIPITGDAIISDTEIYQSDYFQVYIDVIRELLKAKFKLSEIYEVREGGSISIKNVNDCNFQYDGIEYLYTDFNYQIVIYCSHESSITVGGESLISEIHKLWPEYKNHIWTTAFYK